MFSWGSRFAIGTDDLLRFAEVLKVARQCRTIIMANFAGTLGVDGVGVLLAALGMALHATIALAGIRWPARDGSVASLAESAAVEGRALPLGSTGGPWGLAHTDAELGRLFDELGRWDEPPSSSRRARRHGVPCIRRRCCKHGVWRRWRGWKRNS